MAGIQETKKLVKEVSLVNVYANNTMKLTPIIVGRHGVGKSQIMASLAEETSGLAIIIEGGVLKEGEITGIPLVTGNSENAEMRFIPHNEVKKIRHIQEKLYEKLKTTGFLNGKIKMDDNGDIILVKEKGEKEVIEKAKDEMQKVLHGEDKENKFAFLENASGDIKRMLLESGEVPPIFLFIDEINRAEQVIMKEMMNFVLNRRINGYNLPWFVSVVCAANPATQEDEYATNEMDPAQGDRFLEIDVEEKMEDWVEYVSDKGYDKNAIIAFAETMTGTKRNRITQSIIPTGPDISPRSREQALMILRTFNDKILDNSSWFTDEEKSHFDTDMQTLIGGKIGNDNRRSFFTAFARKDALVKPADIFTGKSDKINEDIKSKLRNQEAIRVPLQITTILEYVSTNWEKWKNNKKEGGDKVFKNICLQIEDLGSCLSSSAKLICGKKLASSNGEKSSLYTVNEKGDSLLAQLSVHATKFVTQAIELISEAEVTIKKLD